MAQAQAKQKSRKRAGWSFVGINNDARELGCHPCTLRLALQGERPNRSLLIRFYSMKLGRLLKPTSPKKS